jgi:hypothetical protein
MNKYNVYLADNWGKKEPFITEWDYELIGDKLRGEFDVWFAEQEKIAGSGVGQTKRIIKGEYIKKFMVLKRINLVDNPANGSLRSVFIVKVGEKKVIDKRAKDTLFPRFGYKEKVDKEGKKLDPEGFLKFDLIEGVEEKEQTSGVTFQVSGNDIEYFEEEQKPEEKIEEVVVSEEKFVCEVCSKEFDSKRALHGHSLSHMKK